MTTSTDRARAALGMKSGQQPGTEIKPVDARIAATRRMLPALNDALVTASGVRPETLIRDAITAIRTTPQLVECSESSFFGALMTAAQLGLRPNVPTLGHGWILPRWNGRESCLEAQWQIGYQGMIELAYRSGRVEKITAGTIYEGDEWRERRGTVDVLEHEPSREPANRGRAIRYYAIVWLNGGRAMWECMSIEDIERIRDTYGPRNRQRQLVGPWTVEFEPMAQKTVLRRIWRFMPKTESLSLALSTDQVTRTVDPSAPQRVDVVVDEPVGDAVSEPAAPAAPEQYDEQQQHDERGSDEQGDAAQQAEQEPTEFVTANGAVRELLNPTPTRAAYGQRIADLHGPSKRVRATIEQVVGEYVPPQFLTTSELRRVAEFRWGDESVPQ